VSISIKKAVGVFADTKVTAIINVRKIVVPFYLLVKMENAIYPIHTNTVHIVICQYHNVKDIQYAEA